ARQGPRRRHDPHRARRPGRRRGVRGRRGRRDHRPGRRDRREDGPLHLRQAHPPARHAGGRPLRGARHHRPPRQPVRAPPGRHAPRGGRRRARPRRRGGLPRRQRPVAARGPGDRPDRARTRPRPRAGSVRRARTRSRTGVDVRTALGVVGALLVWFALAFTVPAAVALGTGRPPWPFLAAGAATAVTALLLKRLTGRRPPLGVREGFLVVVAVWLLVPAFGALPYVLGRVPQLDHPLDAYFEAMSGFTATGATVLTDVEALGPDMLFWRQLTHWLGGMGIIVLALAVLPRLRIGGRELLRSELPGPVAVESLDATVRGTAQRLWKVYLAVTAAGFLALAALGWAGLDRRMGLFDAFSYATSAVSLGGFAPDADSAR